MKAFKFLTAQPVFLEIGQSSLKVLDGDKSLELPLERQQNGQLTPSCKQTLVSALQGFLDPQSRSQQRRALCAIGARGVSLRHLTLPTFSKDEFQRVLALQIEAEFPLPPEELAWGYRELNNGSVPSARTTAGKELVVVAVKREVIEDYSEILTRCGLSPVFTLAALVRNSICQEPPATYAMLDIGRNHSELTSFEKGVPTGVRILSWGGDNLTGSIEKHLGIDHAAAEQLKIDLDRRTAANVELVQKIDNAIRTELASLSEALSRDSTPRKVYLSGRTARLAKLQASMPEALRDGTEWELLEPLPDQSPSATILGLKKSFEQDGVIAPLVIQLDRATSPQTVTHATHWKWAVAACLLASLSFFLRYAEALLQKPRLQTRLTEVRTFKQTMPGIEQELSFLQYLQTNQPPYLDAIQAIANATAPGTRVESFSMNRRGDLSFRAILQNPQQAPDFRSKLIDSGFFSTVVLEEQAPAPDRQRIMVRMSAQWKPTGARASGTPPGKNLKAESPTVGATTNQVAGTNAPSGSSSNSAVVIKESKK